MYPLKLSQDHQGKELSEAVQEQDQQMPRNFKAMRKPSIKTPKFRFNDVIDNGSRKLQVFGETTEVVDESTEKSKDDRVKAHILTNTSKNY